jgi:catechol 2,3-dioxygenase-like lactoylglutathione lyase family enzyme
MLQSLNHLTLAVSDLQKSVTFWHELLGLALHARWNTGAYLTCGDLWVCLSYDEARQYVPPQESDYTHYAFTVAEEDFEPFSQRFEQAGVTVWKQNKSEGRRSIFSTRTGTSWSCTWAASPRGWRRVARSPTRAWCLPQTRLEARTFSLPASVTCVAASS